MAARKLATEIDRTLKKVSEGVAQFEDTYDKMQNATNQTQKEKMEADLKTQIKKLQRLRDQIKTWLQSNDIKDKKALLDNRKLIETQMERFKACEKEMKTKAFSKEGLNAAARLDPVEQAKMELREWISNSVDELSRQVEAAEAELETLAGAGKRKKGGASSGNADRIAELERLNERRNWHITKLEVILRLLENGSLETEAISGIKDDISYFVESNADEDFEEDEGIYDEFNLDEEEEAFGLRDNDDMMSSHDGASVADEPPPKVKDALPLKTRRDSEEPVKADIKKTPARKGSDVGSVNNSKAAALKATPPPSQASVASPSKAPSVAPLPAIRYAAAAAAAVSPSQTQAVPAPAPPSASPAASIRQASDLPTDAQSNVTSSDAVGASPPLSHAASHSQQASISQASAATPPQEAMSSSSPASGPGSAPSLEPTSQHGLGETTSSPSSGAPPAPAHVARAGLNGSSVNNSPALTHASARQSEAPSEPQSQPSQQAPPSSQPQQQQEHEFQPAQLAASSAAAGVVQPAGGGAGTTREQAEAQREQGTEARLPSSLADLVSSFESAKQNSMHRAKDLGQVHDSLESSALGVPEPQDTDAPRYYKPLNPWPSPAYYPQTPLNVFDNPSLYSKFEDETLFYTFYYSRNQYHRFLATRELKERSWRLHMRFGTWFQRYSEPTEVSAEAEQGTYIYWDYESSFQARKKQTFRFHYQFLAP